MNTTLTPTPSLKSSNRMNLAQLCHSLSLRERVGVRGIYNGFHVIDTLTLALSRRERGLYFFGYGLHISSAVLPTAIPRSP